MRHRSPKPMKRYVRYFVCFAAGMVLLSFASCKVKYLETQLRYEKAKLKKLELETENKALKTDIAYLNDSLTVMVADYNDLKPYNEQIKEIAALKKEFLRTRVPYYLEMKKRQAEQPKKNKK
jgi:hypothetical protein